MKPGPQSRAFLLPTVFFPSSTLPPSGGFFIHAPAGGEMAAQDMHLDPTQMPHSFTESIVAYLIAIMGIIVGWLDPSKLLVLLSIVLVVIKIAHSALILRRELKHIGRGNV